MIIFSSKVTLTLLIPISGNEKADVITVYVLYSHAKVILGNKLVINYAPPQHLQSVVFLKLNAKSLLRVSY